MLAMNALTCLGILVLSLGFTATAQAESMEEHVRRIKDSLVPQIKDMEEAKQRVDETGGGLAEIDNYLWIALNVVNSAKTASNYELNGRVQETNDLLSLVGKGYLPYWPGNPFNNWEPMKVLQASDGFSAGDLCMIVCPPDAYADMGAGPAPTSYQVFIYGPDESAANLGKIYMAGTNGDWCTAPSGALYGTGFYCMSTKEYEEQQRKLEEYFKTHPRPDTK
jgi:hypothetical protein